MKYLPNQDKSTCKEGGSWASEIVTCMMNVHFDDKGYIGASERNGS